MRVALVSGGGRGLGAAITTRLLADGWTVSVGARDPAAVPAAANATAHHFDADIPETAASWVEEAAATHGRIDALVNNAGILRMSTSSAAARSTSTTCGASTSRRRSA